MKNHSKGFWVLLPVIFSSLPVLADTSATHGHTNSSGYPANCLNCPTNTVPVQNGMTPPASGNWANHSPSGNWAQQQYADTQEAVPAATYQAAPVEMYQPAMPSAQTQAAQMMQYEGTDGEVISSGHLNYVGGNTQVGVGFDSELKGKVEGRHVISGSRHHMTTAEGYLGLNPTADDALGEDVLSGAGVKLNHNWVSQDESGQPAIVHKIFGAYDQNAEDDSKVTVGYGQEKENLFWSGHITKGLSDSRAVGTTQNGALITEKAYGLGVGGRVGTFLGGHNARVQGGLDYYMDSDVAAGEDDASQLTVSGEVEKFFEGTAHSVNANMAFDKKSGGYEMGEDQDGDFRAGVGYRYHFGSDSGVWAADQQHRRVRVEIPGKTIVTKKAPKIQRKLVKHTMELEADTFFKRGDHHLTADAQTRLQSMIARIRQTGHHGNIRVTGNTCDLGSHEINQTLSDRRAQAVRQFLVQNGFGANEVMARGLGETQPKYPNTDQTRHKNRRVDVEYVAYQNKYQDHVIEQGGEVRQQTAPRVTWRKELIPMPPAWVSRALHNTISHDRHVSTFQSAQGGASNLNFVATNDAVQTTMNQEVQFLPFANDSHMGGMDQVNVLSFPNNTVNGGALQRVTNSSLEAATVTYTPPVGFTGVDSFQYTLVDSAGNQATATVTITVSGGAVQSNNVPSDDTVSIGDSDLDSNGNIALSVLDNDTLNGQFGIRIHQHPSNGSIVNIDAGTDVDGTVVEYRPNSSLVQGFVDTFTYVLVDVEGNESAPATVTINGNGS